MPQQYEMGELPTKTREIFSIYSDSARWNDFKFRDGDIVIGSWAKSGTTWTQQIVSQLVFNGKEGIKVSMLSPWVDMRIVPQEAIDALEFQTHRRFVKTHLPADALVFSPKAKYIYIGRDGRDAAWSAYNHFAKGTPGLFEGLNSLPGRDGPPLERPISSVHDFWLDWLAHDGTPLWPFWEHVHGWWAIRHEPNVTLLHFNDLKRDLAAQIRSIADFLGTDIDESRFPAIVEHCTFDYMKAHAELTAPLGGVHWEGGASTFINKGTNGRWTEVLSAEESAAYEARAVAELGPDCAHWLKTGEML